MKLNISHFQGAKLNRHMKIEWYKNIGLTYAILFACN